MNLLIDLSGQQMLSLNELQSIDDINQITFIVPIFLFFQNNFKLLINYAAYISQRPLIKTVIQPLITQDEIKQLQQHNTVLVRGTFDHLHLGHQVLLMKAVYSATNKLIVEVKDDSIMTNKLYKQLIQPVQVRKDNVKRFLEGLKPQLEIKIETITQIYGSAPYAKGIDAVAISQQSIHSLNHINKLRKSNNGLKKVQMILSPLMTTTNVSTIDMRQKRIQGKLSSFSIRSYLLKENNFTIEEYQSYRRVWDSLVKEINSLCRVKDVDQIVVEKWWERIVYKHTIIPTTANASASNTSHQSNRKSNKQIYQLLTTNHSIQTNQRSLKQIGMSLGLFMQGIESEEKSVSGVTKTFLQGLLKKKGKTKSCKKIRKMLMDYIKEFLALRSGNSGGKKRVVDGQDEESRIGEMLLSGQPQQQSHVLQGSINESSSINQSVVVNISAAAAGNARAGAANNSSLSTSSPNTTILKQKQL